MRTDFTGREGRKRERERNINRLPLVHVPPGTEPATQVYALIGNRTCELLVYRTLLQPTEPYQPGLNVFFTSQRYMKVFI